MSRWGKNIVVPLDSLCKEKENTNRPPIVRSVGTVGKWGKMGFTSTRTYALAALPSVSPGQSPSSGIDMDMSISMPDAPKPKKFFKSIANAPPEMFAQFIQQLPRLVPTSPIRDQSTQSSIQSAASVPSSPHESIKFLPAKKKVMERKPKATSTAKSPKTGKARSNKSSDEQVSDASEANSVVEAKAMAKCKKKKELKPEAPPSRVLGRARKAVNYCEDDEEAKNNATSLKEPRSRRESLELSPPSPVGGSAMNAPKAPEHRPIVLRISKGTSRLVDTDNDDEEQEEHSPTSSPQPNDEVNSANSSQSSAYHDATLTTTATTDAALRLTTAIENTNVLLQQQQQQQHTEAPEINYSSVKISPDKPPKERLKLIIKTDVIRNAIAAAAAAAANANSANTTTTTTLTNIEKSREISDVVVDVQQKERKKSKHKHKSKQQQILENNKLPPPLYDFKAPTNGEALTPARTVFSPDFDSQSSVLGSISSKGNSTPLIAHTTGAEESYVVHSRGSSVITSDLETSQHSSLVAPPSDIESRLESMMMDGSETGGASRAATIGADEPLQEDILSVLRGEDESLAAAPLTNGIKDTLEEEESGGKQLVKKRGRPAKSVKTRACKKQEEPLEQVAIEDTLNSELTSTRRSRPTRNTRNNALNNNHNNNNNINKIAANLSAKAEEAQSGLESNNTIVPTSTTRSYGRKRKNQQVMQVLQPSPEELEHQPHAAKVASTEETLMEMKTDLVNNNSPPRQDYKVKDKFKRTIIMDNNQVVATPAANYLTEKDEVEEQQQRGSVKLVISKKKGSIFKSRTLVPENQVEPKRHLYKHRWNPNAQSNNTEEDATNASEFGELFNDFNLPSELETPSNNSEQAAPASNKVYDMDVEDDETTNDESGKRKGFYTVVRNVKTAHQIQEIGEYQEMNDDVQYILDALQPQNPMSTRVLSALQLASKCMNSAFRMHVRSHDVVTKFFRALSDANRDLSLGLCTSAVMYILSQEGLNMDLDRDSLELMMNLLEAENVAAAPAEHATYERNKQKVREMCEEIKAQGKATHLNVDTITVGTLAMETLLSLTSKRAGDWFKEELRELGGLEHIIKTISDCCRPVLKLFQVMPSIIWTGALMDSLKTVERCMRVLENVTQMNEENQKYILKYENGQLVQTLVILYRLCERELLQHTSKDAEEEKALVGGVLRELLMPLMKVFINLTHSFRKESTMGAEVFGQQHVIFETSFQLVLLTHKYIPDRYVFELNILVLLLLINLTMYAQVNRQRVMQLEVCVDQVTGSVSAVQALMEYFYKCEELARLVEKNTDAMLDNKDNKEKKKMEEVDETVNNLIQKAGHHMEHTLKGSYAGILIGHLISDNEENEMIVRRYLHGNGFKEIINVLEKYYTFMNLTASSDAFTVAHIKSTKELIDYYKRRDLIYSENTHTSDTNHEMYEDDDNEDEEEDDDDEIPTTSTRGGTQRVYKTYSSSSQR